MGWISHALQQDECCGLLIHGKIVGMNSRIDQRTAHATACGQLSDWR
jgi:hypothetical protein